MTDYEILKKKYDILLERLQIVCRELLNCEFSEPVIEKKKVVKAKSALRKKK